MKRRPVKLVVRGSLAALAITALILASGDSLKAFRAYEFEGSLVVWPGAQSDRYLSPTTFPYDSLAETLVLESMGLWNIVPGAGFEYSAYRLDQDYVIDHTDRYNDTAAVPANQLDPGILGVTYLVNVGAAWFDMDVLFSDNPLGAGFTLDTNPDCATVTNPLPDTGFSFLLVATHEMGHALGLAHDPVGNEPAGTPWFIATMNPLYPSGGPVGQENIVEVHTDDRAGIRYLYPAGDPPFSDLAVASYTAGSQIGAAVPLGVGPPSLAPGEELLVDSVIENFGTTDEPGARQGFYLSADEVIDTGDELIGFLLWDIVANDALLFGVAIDLPDVPAGAYYVGSILDDLNEVAEVYEDNNAVVHCETITVEQLAPAIVPIPPLTAGCGGEFTGPTPAVTHPRNMGPVTWGLVNAPAGLTIDPGTGAMHWPAPLPAESAYDVTVTASNAAGSTATLVQLEVISGDMNGDAQIDIRDHPGFASCLGGPGAAVNSICVCVDMDFDGDVDLDDVARFQSLVGN